MSQQIKSRKRVVDHGEVFTNEREVKAMCDLVGNECLNICSRFFEPACGDGNFLAEILERKMSVVHEKYKKSSYDFEKYSILALGSLYGVELLIDNVLACRDRLFRIWNTHYQAVCKKECNEETRISAIFILYRNIVCGNALTLERFDNAGNHTGEPIVFSMWSLIKGPMMQRDDCSFEAMLNGNEEEGTLLKSYITHYRRLAEHE